MKKIILICLCIFSFTNCGQKESVDEVYLKPVSKNEQDEKESVETLNSKEDITKGWDKFLDDTASIDTSSNKNIAKKNLRSFEKDKIEKVKKYNNGITIKWLIDQEGRKIKDGEMVFIEYRLALPDGKIIDGYNPKMPFSPFVVGYNMQTLGWDIAFKELSIGDVVKIELPASFAYGAKGFKDLIPGGSDVWLFVKIYSFVEPGYQKNGIKSWSIAEVKDQQKITSRNREYSLHMTLSTKRKANIINTYYHNTPIKYSPGQNTILPGLKDIIESSMKGNRFIVILPPDQAFGTEGMGPDVLPTDSVLVNIEVEDIRAN